MARICFDLDGVICQLKKEGQEYTDLLPVDGAVEKLQDLKHHGHHIIIQTARHMKTCNGNVGLVMQRIGQVTLDWLAKYKIPYDEIYFGKPWAEIYVDDNGFRFEKWDDILGDGTGLPANKEKSLKEKSL